MNIGALALSGWLLLGWMPRGDLVVYDPPAYVDVAGSYLVEIGAEASWGPLFAGGSMRVPVWQIAGELNFWPTQLVSTTDIGLELGPARLGWRHTCAHPVTPYLMCLSDGQLTPRWDSSVDLIYLRLEAGGKR